MTGGTGFIGRRVLTLLCEQGAYVRVLVRPHSTDGEPIWNPIAVEAVMGDLEDATSLKRACIGIDTVLHIAGFAHVDAANTPDFAARHWAINAEGTFRLLDAAVATEVKRFVFLSSCKAVGDPGLRCVDESWTAAADTPYGQAKRAAEERVLTVGRAQGWHVVNLRPVLVYGPGMKGNLARLIAMAQYGCLPPLPETGNRRSLIHVDDVAQAILLAAACPAAAGRTYFVSDGQSYSGRSLYAMICRALGKPVPTWAVPASLLYGVAGLVDGLRRLSGHHDRWARAILDKLLGWACYSSVRIERELDFRPAWTLERYCDELRELSQ
ncbi:MAG: NAD-dependent epimerase/dehydratase family protein [Phycisphaerales bacterium]|nr:NAD-dependent epimerase/dehydratase family protein [Phycisphaerales bacterium]